MAISRPSLDRQPDREPRAAVPPASNTPAFDLEAYVARSRAVDLSAIPWDEIPRHPLSAETIRTLRYMQDIESHTIIYLRSLLATRAIDEPEVATFLACWVYEETFHGIALARFLEAAGHPLQPRAVHPRRARLRHRRLRRPSLAGGTDHPGRPGERRQQGRGPSRGHQGGPPHRPRGRRHRPVLPDELHHGQPRQLHQEEVGRARRGGGDQEIRLPHGRVLRGLPLRPVPPEL